MRQTQAGYKRWFSWSSKMVLLLMGLVAHLQGSVTITSVTPSVPSPQPVGTKVTWTVTAADTDAGPLSYQYSVAFGVTPPAFQISRDFTVSNTFDWTPNKGEGIFAIRVIARDFAAGTTSAPVIVHFVVTTLVTGGSAVVTPTAHPLVALYSAPNCPTGSFMRVWFQQFASTASNFTNWRPCHAGSQNFYIAGMLPGTSYHMDHQVGTGTTVTNGPTVLSFTTGSLPGNLTFPATNTLVSPSPDTGETIVLHDYISFANSPPVCPTATDLNGNVLWYYAPLCDPIQLGSLLSRLLPGGTLLMIVAGPGAGSFTNENVLEQQVLREVDLAGNTLRETNSDRISEQLVLRGTDPIGRFHHDAIRLPNGNTILLGDVQRMFPPGTQGSTSGNPVDIIGDMIVVLDANWQVIWHWNSFEHDGAGELDINRAALLGETCVPGAGGCPPVLLASPANDWLHSNSLYYAQFDGSILVSIRNQSWVVKIDYGNGTGTGNVLWRLGKDGDFSISSSDPYPWFSGQHNASYVNGIPNFIALFDDGNVRVAPPPIGLGSGNSRGQVLNINETARTASLAINADLGVFAAALGSAQRLANGNYFFGAGFIAPPPFQTQSIEVTTAGAIVYNLHSQAGQYRAFRMASLYAPPAN